MTKVAALECAELGYGIRVNSIHPGFIDTALVRDAVEEGTKRPDAVFQSANEMIDMQPRYSAGARRSSSGGSSGFTLARKDAIRAMT